MISAGSPSERFADSGLHMQLGQFLFAPMEARGAAYYRVAWALAVPFFFGGTTNQRLPERHHHPFTTWLYDHVVTSVAYPATLWLLCLLLALGVRPRAIAALLVVLLVPLQRLSSFGTSRMIAIIALAAFAFVRSGTQRVPWAPRTVAMSAGPMWPVRLIQLQLSMVYGANALAKVTPDFLSGNVLVAMSVAQPNFKVDLSSGALELGFISTPVSWLAPAVVAAECFLALGFWIPKLRWFALGFGIAFHLSLTQVIEIGQLDWVTMFLYLAFFLPRATHMQHDASAGGRQR